MNDPNTSYSEGSPQFEAVNTSADMIDELDFDEFGSAMKCEQLKQSALEQISVSTKKKQESLSYLQSSSLTFTQPPEALGEEGIKKKEKIEIVNKLTAVTV
jgi:hypothetical protein